MMMKKNITRTLIASAVLFSFNSTAATSYFEARNDAMGGTGVASSHYGVAPLANPALLTKSAMTGKPSTVPSTATPGYRRQRPA